MRALKTILRLILLVFAGTLLVPSLSQAKGQFVINSESITLPSPGPMFPPGPGAEVANGDCTACHSADMIFNQPDMPKASWLAEINKMRNLYKAPVPEGDIEPIANYLTGLQGRK